MRRVIILAAVLAAGAAGAFDASPLLQFVTAWTPSDWWKTLPRWESLIVVLDGYNIGATNMWVDQSGNGNNFVYSGPVTNGTSGVRFTRGATDSYADESKRCLTNLTQLTCLSVVTALSFANYNFAFSRYSTDAPLVADRFQFLTLSSGWIADWVGSNAGQICAATKPTSTALGIMQSAHIWDGTNFAARLGTTQAGASTGAFNPARTAPLRLGMFAPANAHCLDGTNHCFLIWSVALTSNEVNSAQAILDAKWPGGLR
jgi:hypothetical protein